MASFPDRLKELRKEKNLTQKELANILNITVRNYQRYELSEMDPAASKLVILSNFYNVNVDYLLGNTDVRERYTKEEFSKMKIVSDSLSIADKLESMAIELRKIEQETETINRSTNSN
jgi:transcriptional regulator with XRE-family HTH domain